MGSTPQEEPLEPEIIPPPGKPAPEAPPRPPAPRRKTFFHPWSGIVILGVDWLAFGLELPSGFVDTPVVSVLAFMLVLWAVTQIQLGDGDTPRGARLKALLGAIAAGVPFPVTGTLVGAAILALSGLPERLKFPKK